MKVTLSASEAAFREELRNFYRREIPVDIRERVLAGQAPTKKDVVTAHKILHAAGLAVPQWPKRWGGREFTALQQHIWLDEMQLAGVPEPLFFNVQMLGPVLINFASESLARRFLPATAALDIWWCQGFSEPEAGSDLASLRTRAVREGDHYVVDGQKTWTTLAQHADWIFTLVRTDPTALKRQAGISFLLIDLNSPGVTRRPIELIDGSHEVNEIFFDEVRVPAENLVGQENQGWKYAKFLLGNERAGIGSVGRGKVQLARAKQYAAQSRTPAGTLLDDPLVSARIAELENDLLALELTQLRVVAGSSEGKANPASSVVKLRGSQLQQQISELIWDIAGPEGLPVGGVGVASPQWARLAGTHYLNTRKTTVYGGSSEVQRSIIASTILGL